LAEGRWQPVIEDKQAALSPEKVRRLILCSGKVAVDLITAPQRAKIRSVAIWRVEQLYPLPVEEIKNLLVRYSGIEEVVWLQEEPRNMGAWEFVRLQIARLIGGRCPLHYVGRPRSSSPAEGSSAWHAATQEMLIAQALEVKEVSSEETVLLKKA
ncbi:MAG: 2-oxoglutarate dehydrogenase E1 component, partial [Terriglobia bacterium]